MNYFERFLEDNEITLKTPFKVGNHEYVFDYNDGDYYMIAQKIGDEWYLESCLKLPNEFMNLITGITRKGK